MLAALTDIKLSYVEQINPLLSKAILKVVRTIPDALRTDKTLFKEIVADIAPQIPFATKSANAMVKNILRTEPLTALLKSEIGSDDACKLFGAGFVDYILGEIEHNDSVPTRKEQRTKKGIGSVLTGFINSRLSCNTPSLPRIDGHVLAFRVYIILKMYKNLQVDAARVYKSPFQGQLLCS